MLNQSVAPNEFFSSFALKILCATYPPPPGSAPGYQLLHHCTPRNSTNEISGIVHSASLVNPCEKSGKNESGLAIAPPALAVSALTMLSRSVNAPIPPILLTAIHARTITIPIFKINWNRSVTSTPHNPPINVYIPVKGISTKMQISSAV